MAAATSLAGAWDLRINDAVVIHNSNKLALRLLPCDVFARVALAGQEVAALEVELAKRLGATASPVAALEPRVEPRVYERDGFAVTLWTYYEAMTRNQDSPAQYADALHRLHVGMRSVNIATPHFMERAAGLSGALRRGAAVAQIVKLLGPVDDHGGAADGDDLVWRASFHARRSHDRRSAGPGYCSGLAAPHSASYRSMFLPIWARSLNRPTYGSRIRVLQRPAIAATDMEGLGVKWAG